MSKALVVLSGGQDSTICLFDAKSRYDEVHAVTFDYGQRHRREIGSAQTIGCLTQVASHELIVVPSLAGRSPLTNRAEELENYSDFKEMEQIIGSRVEKTFVPMRNALFLTLAFNRAICRDIYTIVTGVCQADNANYPDCRQVFIDAQQETATYALGLDGPESPKLRIETPLMYMTKAQSVRHALRFPGCYAALAYSHTAYDGSYPPTSKDHASVLRAHGFQEANVPDPLVLRAYFEEKMRLPETMNYKWLIDEIDRNPTASPMLRIQGIEEVLREHLGVL